MGVPFAAKRTDATVPSASEARASSTTAWPTVNSLPLRGAVRLTVGGRFVSTFTRMSTDAALRPVADQATARSVIGPGAGVQVIAYGGTVAEPILLVFSTV